MITRRSLCASGAGLALFGSALCAATGFARAAPGWAAELDAALLRIEAESGGRLGVALLDTLSGTSAGHRADERFPLCSTFKVLAAAAVLARVDAGREQLSRRIRFEAADVVVYSLFTKDRVGGDGVTLDELCEAAITLSDNTAGNLLLRQIGGPSGLTGYARELGDTLTRLDRIEPDLNEAAPGDARDTTTPAAMLGNLHALLLGPALSASSRDRLVAWLKGNKTGDARLRAGLPKDWRVGDKTGSGNQGTTNDIGVAWPPERKPVLIAAYLTGTGASVEQRNAALADIGRAVAAALRG